MSSWLNSCWIFWWVRVRSGNNTELEKLLDPNGSRMMPPPGVHASCDLDLWPPDPQSWSFHAFAPRTTYANLHRRFSKCGVRNGRWNERTDGRTNKQTDRKHNASVTRVSLPAWLRHNKSRLSVHILKFFVMTSRLSFRMCEFSNVNTRPTLRTLSCWVSNWYVFVRFSLFLCETTIQSFAAEIRRFSSSDASQEVLYKTGYTHIICMSNNSDRVGCLSAEF